MANMLTHTRLLCPRGFTQACLHEHVKRCFKISPGSERFISLITHELKQLEKKATEQILTQEHAFL